MEFKRGELLMIVCSAHSKSKRMNFMVQKYKLRARNFIFYCVSCSVRQVEMEGLHTPIARKQEREDTLLLSLCDILCTVPTLQKRIKTRLSL